LPSPIAHSAAGYVAYRVLDRRLFHGVDEEPGRPWFSSLAVSGLSLLPDADSVYGLAQDEVSRYHNSGTHSLLVGLGVASLVGAWAAWRQRARFLTWFLFSLAGYGSHVILDFFSSRRGVMLFWPLSSRRFKYPVKLFYGMRWSASITSKHHVITLVTETAFAAVLFLLLRLGGGSRRDRVAEESL